MMLDTIESLKEWETDIVCAGDPITKKNYHSNGCLNYLGFLDQKKLI